jgi:hypothetical protein
VEQIAKFHKRAVECRERARHLPAEQRALLHNMAETWDSLANERRQRLKREVVQIIAKPRSG